ncbi:MAG: hypothetical protein GTO05_04325, partial [Gemmatimonadales bacterium]|nr:hypothetical protein [Gemmatimonadales bacterium]
MCKKVATMAFAGVIALVACEGVTETSLNQEAPVPSFSAGPVVQSVTGSGHFVYVKDFNYIRIFTDVGQRLADGTVRGQWERNMSHGVVTCMTIIGNQAWLGGYATSGPFSTPPNNEVAWRVTDNGQGANAPP